MEVNVATQVQQNKIPGVTSIDIPEINLFAGRDGNDAKNRASNGAITTNTLAPCMVGNKRDKLASSSTAPRQGRALHYGSSNSTANEIPVNNVSRSSPEQNLSNNDVTPTNGMDDQTPVPELSSSHDQTSNSNQSSTSDPTPTNPPKVQGAAKTGKFKKPQNRKRFFPGRTSTPRRPIVDYPVPEDIRKNIVKILEEYPKGVFVHEIPDLYRVKLKKPFPDFLSATDAIVEVIGCFSVLFWIPYPIVRTFL